MFIVLSSCLPVFSTSIVDNLCLLQQKKNHRARAASLQLGAWEGGSLRMREGESIRGVRSPPKCPGNGWKCI